MDFFSLISMFGGLALFLYGMSILGSGLERLSGGRLERALERMTGTVFSCILLGAAVTAAVQSSSATTVIVVGLVNARVMKLRQAIGVIMGANIGTTVTAHILRLAGVESSNFFVRFLKPDTLAPLLAVAGIILFMTSKRAAKKEVGQIFLGLGILFTGMLTMADSVEPLAELPQFAELFSAFSNPVLGVLAGAVVTAVIQSSSASVGILQALSSTGAITFSAAFPIIMGQNIGTCITPMLASIGASKNAKRTAFVHLTFNVLGTTIFLCVIYGVQYLVGFKFWDYPIGMGSIANFHTIFNVSITLLFVPFVGLLEKIVCKLVKEDGEEGALDEQLAKLDDRLMVSPGLALEFAHKATVQMGKLALKNFTRSMGQYEKFDQKSEERLRETENTIDKLESRLGAYLLKLSERELSEQESKNVSELLQVTSEFERIGDYSMNNAQCAMRLANDKASISPVAIAELRVIEQAVTEIITLAIAAFEGRDAASAYSIEPLEQIIDLIEQTLKERHVERLRQGICTIQTGIPFVETLNSLERIADHCSNIGVHVITHHSRQMDIDRHDYLREVHLGNSQEYAELYRQYDQKYYSQVVKKGYTAQEGGV